MSSGSPLASLPESRTAPPVPGHVDVTAPLNLELRYLRMLVAIADEKSLTRAGERLNITQSALSHQLRLIEDRLRVQLFERVGKRLVITEAGAALLARARKILHDVVVAEQELAETVDSTRGVLRISIQCHASFRWLPRVIARFAYTRPQVDIRVVPTAAEDPLHALTAGLIDLAVIPQRSPDAADTELFSDELVLVTPPRHRLANIPRLSADDLRQETLFDFVEERRSFLFKSLFSGDSRPARVVVLPMTDLVLEMVQAGLGVAVLPAWAIDLELRRNTLAVARFHPPLIRHWYAVTSTRASQQPFAAEFLRLISAEALPVRYGSIADAAAAVRR